jgi:hypothetical protein
MEIDCRRLNGASRRSGASSNVLCPMRTKRFCCQKLGPFFFPSVRLGLLIFLGFGPFTVVSYQRKWYGAFFCIQVTFCGLGPVSVFQLRSHTPAVLWAWPSIHISIRVARPWLFQFASNLEKHSKFKISSQFRNRLNFEKNRTELEIRSKI